MGDFVRAVTGVLAASTVCCTAAGTGSPPLPTTYVARVDVPDPAPAAPADPLPPGPDFNAIAAPAPPGKATTFYSLDAASHLVRFTSEAPWKLDTHTVTGLAAGERLAGLAFRPADEILYALGSTSRLYRIDRQTGSASPVTDDPFHPGLDGKVFGIAFGADDAARIASDTGQNIAIDPVTGWVANFDASLAYGDSDVLTALEPGVVATTYANGVFFGIDATHDVLTRLVHPANGSLDTVGALGVDVGSEAGIDVTSDGRGFAVLRAGGESALYTLDLDRGSATKLASIGTTALHALAIER